MWMSHIRWYVPTRDNPFQKVYPTRDAQGAKIGVKLCSLTCSAFQIKLLEITRGWFIDRR